MNVTVKRLNQAVHFEATNETGESIHMDGSPKIGGEGNGPTPMQMMLMAMGGCSGIDIVEILKKMKQPLQDFEMEINGDREPDKEPSLFTEIRAHYKLYGDIEPKKAERAITLSVEKYCSVAKILERSAKISWTYEIIS